MKNKKQQVSIPKKLIPGDTIGIVAPAGPFDREKFEKGVLVLEKMGFKVLVPNGLFKQDTYLAGSDSHRADMVNSLFKNASVDAIICARGGFGSIRILSLLDYQTIQKNPKIFMGFSDISALLSVLNDRCQLVCFHGPMVTTLSDIDQESKDSMVQSLTSGKKLRITLQKGLTIKSGKTVGKVSGGNLATLCHLIGTPFEPDFKDCILVIEDIGEATYKIDRMLIQMKLAGCFKDLAGLVLGSFKDCGKMEAIYEIVEKVFREDTFPILAGFEIGHGTSNHTIPIGLPATLDADDHLLLYNESATAA